MALQTPLLCESGALSPAQPHEASRCNCSLPATWPSMYPGPLGCWTQFLQEATGGHARRRKCGEGWQQGARCRAGAEGEGYAPTPVFLLQPEVDKARDVG